MAHMHADILASTARIVEGSGAGKCEHNEEV